MGAVPELPPNKHNPIDNPQVPFSIAALTDRPACTSTTARRALPARHHAAEASSSCLSPAYSVPWFAVLRRAQRFSSTTVSVAA